MSVTSASNFAENVNDYIHAAETEKEVICIKTNDSELYLVDKILLEEMIDEPHILRGMEEIQQGKCVDGKTFLNELMKKYETL